MGTQKNRLNETVLLSTQNICEKLRVRKCLQFYAEKMCLSKPKLYCSFQDDGDYGKYGDDDSEGEEEDSDDEGGDDDDDNDDEDDEENNLDDDGDEVTSEGTTDIIF